MRPMIGHGLLGTKRIMHTPHLCPLYKGHACSTAHEQSKPNAKAAGIRALVFRPEPTRTHTTTHTTPAF